MDQKKLIILLDFDGVMVTTPSWRKVEILEDGFMAFNNNSTANLTKILKATSASIVLTTTHRLTYGIKRWLEIFAERGIAVTELSKINEAKSISEMKDRAAEIEEWVAKNGSDFNYIIIDDDPKCNNLPQVIRERWVQTSSMTGLDGEALNQVLNLVNN